MNAPMPFNWRPDPVSVAQFATRIRMAFGSVGVISTAEIGYEYSTKDGVLYRVVGSNWQPIGDIMELSGLNDEQLYARCRQ